MDKISIIETINSQINLIGKENSGKRELVLELAILKAFVINQELFPEMEEFRNLIFIELDTAGNF